MDIEVPTVVLDQQAGPTAQGADTELDLANIVQSAAKGLTTVQEAPAIVTVVTQDEIRDRQFQTFEQIIDTVPGWLRLGGVHSQFPFPLARGQIQAGQLLHDGVSMTDPYVNNQTFGRIQAVELIKRIEVITGPGGVLWGANSMMGVVNVVTKDAEDVDGVEVGGQLGGGPGDRNNARVYAMVGMPELLHGKMKVFLHTSFETFQTPAFQMPEHLFSQPVPQPNALILYGPLTTADPPQSYLFNFHTKVTFGKLQLRAHIPWADRHPGLGFPGNPVQKDLGEDTARGPDGQLLCPFEMPYYDPGDQCVDKGRVSRDNEVDFVDRYVVGEYRTRFAGGRAGMSAKIYGVSFVRHFEHLNVLSPVPGLLEGGLSFKLDFTSYRAGAAFDGDVELPRDARLLYGVEAFREWFTDNTTGSRQGAGREAFFIAPYQLERLPVPCPRDLDSNGQIVLVEGCPQTAGFLSDRVIFGAYINPQWRASKRLILDAGARINVSPGELGDLSYPATPTFGGSVVYGFLPDWHLKLNVTQGFRPPVFNNLISNGESIALKGDPDLKVETSTAAQVEVNARLFKGDRRIREFNFRTDYSYTLLQNLIQIIGGHYSNSADRGIHSVEFLGKLYVQGGHRVELGYTWLKVLAGDYGSLRVNPEHWFNLAAVFNLIDGKLEATSTLRVLGAMEDPNRIVEWRDLTRNELGRSVDKMTGAERTVVSGPSELVLDRLPPAADIMFGLQWYPMQRMAVRASILNAFNERYYQPDAFSSYEPRLEYLANPYEDVRAYLSASYQY